MTLLYVQMQIIRLFDSPEDAAKQKLVSLPSIVVQDVCARYSYAVLYCLALACAGCNHSTPVLDAIFALRRLWEPEDLQAPSWQARP